MIERPISLFDGSEEVAGDFHILWREGRGNGIGAELGGAWGGGLGRLETRGGLVGRAPGRKPGYDRRSVALFA